MRFLWLFFLLFIGAWLYWLHKPAVKPRVSLITSIYKGDPFIEQFMAEIVKQTIFDQCELLLINANSPGNEEKVIAPYLSKYSNVRYIKLDQDPGLYGVWNMAIKLARGEYIMNANLDDGLAYDACEKFAKTLDENSHVDLVYSDFYMTQKPHYNFYDLNDKNATLIPTQEFSYDNLRSSRYCMPNNHPMWRKSVHEKYGYFDESYIAAADCDLWARMALGGSQFKRVPGVLGFWYYNPEGLSTKKGQEEICRVKKLYPVSLPNNKKM